LVREAREQEPGLSVNEACKRIGPQLGIVQAHTRRAENGASTIPRPR
jgi:hypothetical protein